MLEAEFPAIVDAVVVDCEPQLNRRRPHVHSKLDPHALSLAPANQGAVPLCALASNDWLKPVGSIPINLNDPVTITLLSKMLSGRIAWLNGRHCGVVFDQPVGCFGSDIATDRIQTSVEAASVKLPAIGADRRVDRAGSTDSSRYDVNVANDHNFRPGLRVQVILEDGREKTGIVHWSRDNIAGLTLLPSLR